MQITEPTARDQKEPAQVEPDVIHAETNISLNTLSAPQINWTIKKCALC